MCGIRRYGFKNFPIFLNVKQKHISVIGGGDTAIGKLRLLLKTEGQITVDDNAPALEIRNWHDAGVLTISQDSLTAKQASNACFIYVAQKTTAAMRPPRS